MHASTHTHERTHTHSILHVSLLIHLLLFRASGIRGETQIERHSQRWTVSALKWHNSMTKTRKSWSLRAYFHNNKRGFHSVSASFCFWAAFVLEAFSSLCLSRLVPVLSLSFLFLLLLSPCFGTWPAYGRLFSPSRSHFIFSKVLSLKSLAIRRVNMIISQTHLHAHLR